MENLGNIILRAGKAGRLDCMNVLPVVAGDVIDYTINGVFRLSPLRRNTILDPVIDIVTCYVPMRHIYSNWMEWIEAGPQGGVSLATVSQGDLLVSLGGQVELPYWVLWQRDGGPYPAWLVEPYKQVWNRYWRPPKAGIAEKDFVTQTENDVFGWPCARLPRIWNLLHTDNGVDDEVASVSTVRLTDIAKQMSHYKREQQGEWYLNYYDDYVRGVFGGSTDIDADERPEILGHTSMTSGGFNVYGTASDSLGMSTGRNETVLEHRFPRKFMPEHGVVITVMAVRFPDICANEIPWFMSHPSPTYEEFACDPQVLGDLEPQLTPLSDFFNFSGTSGDYYMPAGEPHRWHTNVVHRYFMDRDGVSKGWPIIPTGPVNLHEAATFSNSTGTDSNFTNTDYFLGQQLLDWNFTGQSHVSCKRALPGIEKSIYAGADLNQG